MSEFTYENNETTRRLETFEWDNVWWEHTEKTNARRILVVGDSISCGYRPLLNKRLAGEVFIDGFGTSKAIDNPFFIKALELFADQMNRVDGIIFNSGLHGWHLSAAEYKQAYRKTLEQLTAKYKGVKITLALTTPLRNPSNLEEFDARNDRVIERNEAVREIAAELGLTIMDFYSLLCEKPWLYSGDGVHLSEEGYELLAGMCADYILSVE